MLPKPSTSIYQSNTCFVTYGTTGHIDPKQPPHRGKPWTAIAAQDFIHRVDLICPEEFFAVLKEELLEEQRQPCYARMKMTLGQVLDRDFLTHYIKKRTICMLSKSSSDLSTCFSLNKGILNIYVDRETFERAGLSGKPYGVKGDRGAKARWIISYDLSQSWMTHGKRGFERLLRACKTVFNEPVQWLFCDADSLATLPEVFVNLTPSEHRVDPTLSQSIDVPKVSLNISPDTLANGDRLSLERTATELYEWLSLIRLQSPRVAADDAIDPYLSRYHAPAGDSNGTRRIFLLSWEGFIATSWFRSLVRDILRQCSSQQWFSISATSSVHGLSNSKDLTLFRPLDKHGEYLLWEVRGLD